MLSRLLFFAAVLPALCSSLLIPSAERLERLRWTPEQSLVFVKVPKTASSSLQMDLQPLGRDFGGVGQGERCFDAVLPPGQPPAFSLTFLRSPRAHVVSQYLECRHGSWSQKVTKNTSFPRSQAQELDVPLWLQYFQPDEFERRSTSDWARLGWRGDGLPDFNCYSPIEAVSRQLSSACTRDPHHWYPDNWIAFSNATGRREMLLSAVRRVGQFSFVGIQDLYNLSLCLLYDRLRLELPAGCFDAAQPVYRTFVRHGRADIRPSTSAVLPRVSPAALAMADAVTRSDSHVFVAAVARLLGEARAFQDRARAGASGARPLGGHLLDWRVFLESIDYIPARRRRALPVEFEL